MIVLITGPEKTGKTTAALELVKRSRELQLHAVYATLRRYEKLDPSVYTDLVKLGCRTDTLVVMDRGWPDEFVYGNLLNRPQAFDNSWAEWCLGSVVRMVGGLYVFCPPHRLAELDDTDLQVHYAAESAVFRAYGEKWGYEIVDSSHGDPLGPILANVKARRWHMETSKGMFPPYYVGPVWPKVVFIGQERNENTKEPMAWAPMTTYPTFRRVSTRYHEFYNHLGRTNARDLKDKDICAAVLAADVVVAMGKKAQAAVAEIGYRGHLIETYHPSAVFRWGRFVNHREVFSDQIEEALRRAQGD